MAKTTKNSKLLVAQLIIAIPAALGLICLLVASVFGIVQHIIRLVNIFSNFGGIYSVTNLIHVLTGLLKDLIAFLPYVLAAAFALFYGKKKEGFWQGMAFGAAALTFLMAIIAWPLQNLGMVFSQTVIDVLKAFGRQIPGMLLDLLRAILLVGSAFLAIKQIKKNNIPLFLIPLAIAVIIGFVTNVSGTIDLFKRIVLLFKGFSFNYLLSLLKTSGFQLADFLLQISLLVVGFLPAFMPAPKAPRVRPTAPEAIEEPQEELLEAPKAEEPAEPTAE